MPGLSLWLENLEKRHLANLRFAEVTRALRALSSAYVERRAALTNKNPFDTAGKRAAYGLYYGPLHFLTVRAIVEQLPGALDPLAHLADWGCGTGAAGAAWATSLPQPPSFDLAQDGPELVEGPRIIAIDSHPWAVTEAAVTYAAFGLAADVRRGDVARARVPPSVDGLIAGWVMNELSDATRGELLPYLLELAARGVRVLVVEPIATRVSPWWPDWAAAFERAGGRADEWTFRVELPELLRRLDRSSGMRHDELKARSLWVHRNHRSD